MATKSKRGEVKSTWRDLARKELLRQKKMLTKRLAELNENIVHEAEVEKTFYPRPWIYWTIAGLYLILQLAISLIAPPLWSEPVQIVGAPFNVGLAILILQGLHLLLSFRTVGVDELAGIDFFGRPTRFADSGLQFVPLFLLTLTKASRNYRDARFPGPPDAIFRISREIQREREGGDIPSEGKVRPIFVTTGEPREVTDKEREQLLLVNPLDQQLSVEIAYFVRYRPNQEAGGIFRIARNLTRGGNVDERIFDLIREQGERDIKSIITSQTTATVIENWGLVNEVFALRLQVAILRLGIQIDPDGAGLDDLNPSHDTNEEQAEVARSRFRRSQAIIAADGEREKRRLEGQGTADAERFRLEALARGYRSITEATGAPGEAVIASETAKASLNNADTIVVGTDGIKELFGLVKAGQDMLARSKQSSPPKANDS